MKPPSRFRILTGTNIEWQLLDSILEGGPGRVNDVARASSGLGKTPKGAAQGWIWTTLRIGGGWAAPKAVLRVRLLNRCPTADKIS